MLFCSRLLSGFLFGTYPVLSWKGVRSCTLDSGIGLGLMWVVLNVGLFWLSSCLCIVHHIRRSCMSIRLSRWGRWGVGCRRSISLSSICQRFYGWVGTRCRTLGRWLGVFACRFCCCWSLDVTRWIFGLRSCRRVACCISCGLCLTRRVLVRCRRLLPWVVRGLRWVPWDRVR